MIRAIGRVLEADPTRLVMRAPEWPGHRPGQFAMLALDPGGRHLDPLLPRPMAIYRGSAQELEFRFKVIGRGTRILAELQPGSEIGILGPLGRGFPEPSGRPLLIGGGTGIASLYELAVACGSGARVLLGGRSAADILGLEDFRALAAALELTTDDGSAGHRGLVTDVLEPKPGDEVFACGPTPMMRRAFEIARAAGVRCWVSLENTMACGFGICLGCGVPAGGRYRYVCTDGPVFDASSLDWEGLP